MFTRSLTVRGTLLLILLVAAGSVTATADGPIAAQGTTLADHDVNGSTGDVAAVYNVSVTSSYSGFAYLIDGVQQRELTLVEGKTYEFRLGSSVAGHPFHLSRGPVGGGGNFPSQQLTAGVNVTDPYRGNEHAAETGVFRVTVPEDGFDVGSLYYQCGIHSGMGAQITTVPGPSIPALPNATGPPGNLDGDATLEDVDGDGTGDVFDVLTYYNVRESETIRTNASAFDYDGDGTAGTVFDALALYAEIS